MNSKHNIRNLYTPIQPPARISDERISYVEIFPEIKLYNYIYCYWNLKTIKPLNEPYNYRVVADGCIDVFFELTNHKEMFVMGFCNSFTEFDINTDFNYFGIRFLPGAFSSLFNVNALELNNRSEHLDLVQKKLFNFIQLLLSANTNIANLCFQLNNYFINYIYNNPQSFDNRFYNALANILYHKGQINLEKDLSNGISSRHLRRLFNFYIGDTAKSFCRVVRFQNLLKIQPSVNSFKTEKLFYDFGYYDQTHFIKDFKQFYGSTPSKALIE